MKKLADAMYQFRALLLGTAAAAAVMAAALYGDDNRDGEKTWASGLPSISTER